MTAELLVNVTPSETRVAYIDGGILQEIHIEREARRGIVGNIYKGRKSCTSGYAGGFCRYWAG